MAHIKSLDETRPATIVIAEPADLEFAGQFSDILSFNLYASWYDNTGDLDTIIPEVLAWAKSWRDKYNRTVLITEYGGDTMEGLHFLPSFVWSEDYQKNLLSQHFQGFDQLRTEGWFIGEMVWNFADFKTDQAYTRVGGNKKGLFTRVRQPKAAALLMRQRYWRLGEHLDGVTLPNDLEDYVILAKRDEL